MRLHEAVMVEEVVNNLIVDKNGGYVDCTFGTGGHSLEILKKMDTKGSLTALDKDIHSIHIGKDFFSSDKRFKIIKTNFSNLSNHLEPGSVDGVLIDLGISSKQLDDPNRGFSFIKLGPLDMRIDQSEGATAEKWINRATKKELEVVFKELGEERYYQKIAMSICKRRQKKAITSTQDLVDIVLACKPRKSKRHPATKVFRAIRMKVNQELMELHKVLDEAGKVLKFGGRLVVISFHSIEDRIVKRFILGKEKIDRPVKFKPVGKNPLKPTKEEVNRNPRSRSAILRVAEKVA